MKVFIVQSLLLSLLLVGGAAFAETERIACIKKVMILESTLLDDAESSPTVVSHFRELNSLGTCNPVSFFAHPVGDVIPGREYHLAFGNAGTVIVLTERFTPDGYSLTLDRSVPLRPDFDEVFAVNRAKVPELLGLPLDEFETAFHPSYSAKWYERPFPINHYRAVLNDPKNLALPDGEHEVDVSGHLSYDRKAKYIKRGTVRAVLFNFGLYGKDDMYGVVCFSGVEADQLFQSGGMISMLQLRHFVAPDCAFVAIY